jgi:hypothetical protein
VKEVYFGSGNTFGHPPAPAVPEGASLDHA